MATKTEQFHAAVEAWKQSQAGTEARLQAAGAEFLKPNTKIEFFVRPMREPASATVLWASGEHIKVLNTETGRERRIHITDVVHVGGQ